MLERHKLPVTLWVVAVTLAMAWPIFAPPVNARGVAFREDTMSLEMFDMTGDTYAAILGAVDNGRLRGEMTVSAAAAAGAQLTRIEGPLMSQTPAARRAAIGEKTRKRRFSVDLDHRLGSSCTGPRLAAPRRGAATRLGCSWSPAARGRGGHRVN